MTLEPILAPLSLHQGIALASPPLLIVSMWLAFKVLHARFYYPTGYFLGFLIYWVVWCLLFPAWLLGGFGRLVDLFRPVQPLLAVSWPVQLLLWWPIFFPLFFRFIPKVVGSGWRVLVASLLLGVVIGVTEEILWRGLFLSLFPGNPWLGVVYPSLMFGLWHISPQAVLKNQSPGGRLSFVLYAAILGLSYAFAARQNGSIFWPVVSHVLHDTLGLGGFAYAAWLSRSGKENRRL